MDELAGADDVDWADLGCAFGPADAVGDLLRGLVSEDAAVRDHGLDTLISTVWHQGTVYEVTPATVPFLVAVVLDTDLDPATRSGVCFLLSCLANADSFVLPDSPTVMRVARWRRPEREPAPGRDLVDESRLAVAAHAGALVAALSGAPPPVATGLLAALAAVAPDAPVEAEAAARQALGAADRRITAAAEILRGLARRDLSDVRLRELADLDPTARDLLPAIAEWPVEVRAAQIVQELMTAVTDEDPSANQG